MTLPGRNTLPLIFVLHLGEDCVLSSCLLSVKDTESSQAHHIFLHFDMFEFKNILCRTLKMLWTSIAHTTEQIWFFYFLILCHLLTHACITCAQFRSPSSLSEVWYREWPLAAKKTEQSVISEEIRVMSGDDAILGQPGSGSKREKCYGQHEKQQIDNMCDICSF